MRRLLLTFISLSILLSFSFLSLADTVEFGELTLVTTWNSGSRHYDFPDAVMMSNGNILIAYGNGTGHSGGHSIEIAISTDNGSTWGSRQTIVADDGEKNADLGLCVSSNGTVILTHRKNGDSAEWYVSYDNGTTWVSKGAILGSTFAVTGLKLINGVVYGAATKESGGYNASVIKSTDNGSTWERVSWIDDYDTTNKANSEWDFVNINDTHWIAVFRAEPRSTLMTTIQAETFDAGVTWENFTNITADIGNIAVTDPNLCYIRSDVILLHTSGGLTNASDVGIGNATCFFSIDDGTTWINQTNYYEWGSLPVADPDGGYDGSVPYIDDEKALLIVYGGNTSGRCDIWSRWVYYNSTSLPNNNPNVTAAYPTNGSTNLTLSITYLSINLTDPDGDLMNYTYMYFTESCTTTGSNTSGLTNGTYNIPITCTLTRNTTYHWWVNVTDSNGGYDNETFLFTTKDNHTTQIRITATGTGISDYSYGGGSVFILLGLIITITLILAIVVYLKQYI